MWQAEAVKELTLPASPATAVGEQTLTLANWRYSTVTKGKTTIFDLTFYDEIRHMITKSQSDSLFFFGMFSNQFCDCANILLLQ